MKFDGDYFRVPNDFVDQYGRVVGRLGISVYMVLSRHSDKGGYCFPSVDLIAGKVKASCKQVSRVIKVLEKWNLLSVRRERGHQNIYCLVTRGKWAVISPASSARAVKEDVGLDWLNGKNEDNAFPKLVWDSALTCEWGHDFGGVRRCSRCGFLQAQEYYEQMGGAVQ